ncbi:MAG: LysR family transcriptional regulator [Rhizobiaceae bacterium]|nr:LysR family transcriptional regulator [Rhizobiaceae bacterium]
MNDNQFDGMVIFCAVVDQGGFTAAAKALNHTTSHVSKVVARLEARLGSRLMNRTTRTFSLTESGEVFYENSSRIIKDAEHTLSLISQNEERAFGHLKVSVPVMFADACLNGWLPEFVNAFPDITLEIESSDRFVDIVAEGFDVVVRAADLDDSLLIARKIMSTRRLTVASPDYLARHGTPAAPGDLETHTLIDFSYRGIANMWTYRGKDGGNLSVRVTPKIRCNIASMELALASSGFGITRLPLLVAENQLKSGELVAILTDYENPPLELHAIYPSRQHLAPKVREFVDFLARKCRELA